MNILELNNAKRSAHYAHKTTPTGRETMLRINRLKSEQLAEIFHCLHKGIYSFHKY